ncbi:hypothetical protein G7Z17_g9339 [Cylindrodendrum hubeiense]|uniref:Phage protein n=1 Tax=Cylindrodendrum hubeiense TaxID=595255 RepID=A0A9P5H9G0_9HYPO|nr:hypothetical protein G7Z17_g9339 [Cylindrodendrum hubeiense]
MSEKAAVVLEAYTINGYQAPDHCESCDASVPDAEARRKHMEETRHRICSLCESYAPLGGYYVHCDERHYNDKWNDHMVAYTDSINMKESQQWAVEAIRKKRGGD